LPKKIIHELRGESCCQYKETKDARILDIAYKEFSSNWEKNSRYLQLLGRPRFNLDTPTRARSRQHGEIAVWTLQSQESNPILELQGGQFNLTV
jgi:hypothetical protein